MTILVTGANGFVGVAACRALLDQGYQVAAAVRRADAFLPLGVDIRVVDDLGPATRWRHALDGIHTVIHLAARVHVMKDRARDPLAQFVTANTHGTLTLAEQAAHYGVQRFIFVSTIKVNGECTRPGQPFRADDPADPRDPYGQSKAMAETALAQLAHDHGLSLAIIRPPLVHGPGARGNLATLMTALRRGVPLPLGAVANLRSLVGVDNLAHALAFLATHRHQGTFLIRDGQDISTPDLIRRLGRACGCSPHLPMVPPALLHLGAKMLGKGEAARRILGSLQVDDQPLRDLGWHPPLTLDQGLDRMGAWFTHRS